MDRKPNMLQIIWGGLLAAAGIGVFIMLPRRMAQIAEARQADPASIDMLFLWFCFGLLGVLLICGGLRKIYHCLKTPHTDDHE